MELAKNLAQWRDQTPDQWVTRVNQVLPGVVIAVIVILIAARAVDLTWALLDKPAEQDLLPAAVPAGLDDSGTQMARSLEPVYGLFGEAPAPEDVAAIAADLLIDAPETDLPLMLTGLLVAQELPERGSTVIPEAGSAIIAVGRNPQQAVRTGDVIEGVPNTTLYVVLEDRVTLDRGGGRLETLFYRPEDNDQTSVQLNSRVAQREPSATRAQSARMQPQSAASAAEQLSGIATTLLQHIDMQPAPEGGEVIGMRLQARGDGQVFTSLGFEPGDIMLEVNGLRTTNLLDMQALSQALTETTQASVRIRRNGNNQVVIVDMSDLQQLAESFQ